MEGLRQALLSLGKGITMDDIGLFDSYVDMTPTGSAVQPGTDAFGNPSGGPAYSNAVAGSTTGQAYSSALDTIYTDPKPLDLSQPFVDAKNAVESGLTSLIPSKSTIVLVAVILLLVLLIIGKVETL